MQSEILRGPGHWGAVRESWAALAAARPPASYLQLPEWVEAVDAVAAGPDARWFVAADADGPLAVLACTMRRRTYAALGFGLLANARDADGLVADRFSGADLRRELLTAMAHEGEPVDGISLNGLRGDSGFYRLAAASRRLRVEPVYGGYSVIDTQLGGDDWFAAAGRNLRASLRKARNRLDREGALRIDIATTAKAVATAYRGFIEIEGSGWKGRGGGLGNRPTERELIRRFLGAATAADGATAASTSHGAAGRACVRSLWVADRLAASQICCVVGRTLVLLKVAYLDDLAHLSPGSLLMADLIRQCCADPAIDRIDLVTAQPWHDRWHPTRHPTYQARDFNLGRAAGIVGRVGDRAVATLRVARHWLGPSRGPARPSDGLPTT